MYVQVLNVVMLNLLTKVSAILRMRNAKCQFARELLHLRDLITTIVCPLSHPIRNLAIHEHLCSEIWYSLRFAQK